MTLYVDFGPARRLGVPRLSHASFAWSGLALPDSEPIVHDWLRLRAPLGDLVLDMRVRTLVGKSGNEIRLRDEIAVEVSGDSLASSIDASIEVELTTSLLAHDLEPNRARLQFRGRGAGRRVLVTDEQRIEEQSILDGLNYHRSLVPEPPEYRYHDMEWLLCETALVDHIEYALAILRPSASS